MTEYQRQFQARVRALWNENHPEAPVLQPSAYKDPTETFNAMMRAANPPCETDQP